MATNSVPEQHVLNGIEEEGISNLKTELHKMYDIWVEFGIDIQQKSNRARDVWRHVQTLLKDIYDEENTLYENIKERIQNYTAKINELSRVLAVECNEPQGSLIKREEKLRHELDSLNRLKNRRMKSYHDLKTEELKYCQILNLQEHQLPPNAGVPSESDLEELEQHIKMLKDEKDRRQKKFHLAKKELTTILETTELVPETSLEVEILSGKETMSLTNETLKALEEVILKAQKRKAEMEAKKKALINKLTVLWERLKVDEKKRVDFLSKYADCRPLTIRAIEQELERCEDLKKQNIGTYVSDLRIELVQLWDKCHVSQPDRDLFYYFSSTDMSDEVLEAHEEEVEKWKKYYNKVEPILKKIEKRKQLWDLMIKLENKTTDPNRFKNRKGNLLQEERERRKLQKDLPALENNIFVDIEEFEAHNGSTFLYNGEDFRSFVTNQWTERINAKENEKLGRHNQIKPDGLICTPAKRPIKTTPKTAPSKLFKSSMATSLFRTPAAGNSKVVPSTVGKVLKNMKLFPLKTQTMQKKDQNVLREINKQVAKTTSPNATTYTDFALELNRTARYNFRSSVLATRKPGGTRTIQTEKNKSKRKSAALSLRKSMKNTSTNLTPARGKLGLPFII